jgi:alpha-L-rhamnosidase
VPGGLLAGLLLGLSFPGLAAVKPSVEVTGLRCEYLKEPLGLDVAQPRLSWKLAPTNPKDRGQRQTAYQVLVASGAETLAKQRGDRWDSGEVATDQSVHVVYQGQRLRSGDACWWQVRVKNERGTWSAWSAPARWTMGLLEPGDWSAKWIGTDQAFTRKPGWPPPDNTMPDPWFRKVVSLAAKPQRATIYVASIGYHELYVNGQKAGDAVLSPSATDHSKRARYVTYEIADLLKPGPNVLGLWLGTSWSIYPQYLTPSRPATPMVIAHAEIDLAGGQHLRFATDESWKTHPSPNTLLGVWDFMHFGGDLYDANKEILNWCSANLDESAWKAATVYRPQLVLSAEKVEPNRLVKEVRPVGVEEKSPGVFRVDLGVNFAGWTEVDVEGKPGDRIEFQYSENPSEAMTHRLHSAYIIGPTGKGTFRNRFNYSVGRWLTIKGLARKPALKQIRGWLVRTDYERAAEFDCNLPLLNDLYRTTLWTFENLSLGAYLVDCPHRERMGYGGDAHATINTALANYNLGAFYTKWAEDWRDVQGKESAWGVGVKDGAGAGKKVESGNLPYTAPTYWGGGGPGWSGFCVTLPWEVYQRYGDRRILEENFPMIQAWLGFLETKSKDNKLVRWGGEWDFLGDWLWPGAKGVNGDTSETLFFNNCYWIYNLQTAAKIADTIGKADAASAYRQRADTVRQAVHKEFFAPDRKSYVNGFQAYLAIALLVDLPPAELRPAVWESLNQEIARRKGHIWAGITGGAFVMKTLLAADQQSTIYNMAVTPEYPGWTDMLRQGATTFWESWENNKDLSYLHSSFLYLGTWFIEGVGGIKPDPASPGFKHFKIRLPAFMGTGLTKARARYDSIHGPIQSEWSYNGRTVRLTVSVPPNTTADCFFPCNDTASIHEGGRKLKGVNGVEWVGLESGQAHLRLQPGDYSFKADYPTEPVFNATLTDLANRAARR